MELKQLLKLKAEGQGWFAENGHVPGATGGTNNESEAPADKEKRILKEKRNEVVNDPKHQRRLKTVAGVLKKTQGLEIVGEPKFKGKQAVKEMIVFDKNSIREL